MTAPYVTPGAVAGFDFAGVVEMVGPDATKCDIRVGDRVCTAIMGMNPLDPTVAIQLVKLAGFAPITTCSPRNFELVKSYGASAIFDYNDPDCISDIKKHTKNNIRYALNCIFTTQNMQFCYQAIGRPGGKYTALEPYSEAIAGTRKIV
ncbi:uncharacterized protein FIESC28_03428 [Fusarium coffeatum]|uniref:Alcohol dehydrogenase-like C-terminal domain-containing protein n=1 Tax=Fusarium coffeatum TaxID=231269 RepID=A0A366S470_9HYPO|nr:uncharacterized protein FIESC28_03428 [Fusarium coffeatum]RBR23812.1 hypothetical protein FIESC28_03428 [Fusarium coffeatum]